MNDQLTESESVYRVWGSLGTSLEDSERKALAGLTIWHVHRFIEAVFTFAVGIECDIETNPARKTKPKATRESRRPPAVDVSEVERFLAAAKKDRGGTQHSSRLLEDAEDRDRCGMLSTVAKCPQEK